ncbi:MAG: class I SAM-dependent methyltransferase [Clostridia bacterium]|nr:class I SAM-dependent methyltransferase [Clostridia bacterium]
MKNIICCPICNNEHLNPEMDVADHFLTKEVFHLTKCTQCGFLFTNPRPNSKNLSTYYQSDDYLSHSKKKSLTGSIYNFVKEYSLAKKFQLISRYHSRGKLLDIGSATGEFLQYFKKKNWDATGIEPAEAPRQYSIHTYGLNVFPEEKIDQLAADQFDVVTLWHVLEHVPDLNQRMEQISKLLAPEGLLVIALPNYLSWDAQHYGNFWAGYDVPRHLYHFTPATISQLLSKYQFEIFKTEPLKFDAFYVSLLSEKYRTGKSDFLAAFRNGLKSNKWAKQHGENYSSLIYLAKKEK